MDRIAGYAALVVLMIAVGYVFMRRDQDKDQAYVVEGNIEPEGKKPFWCWVPMKKWCWEMKRKRPCWLEIRQ